MNRVTGFWSETAPSAKWATYICLPLGVTMTAFGVYGDTVGWWDNFGFLTNLLSSMTSVLFGIPTALVVLGWLNTHQAETQARLSIRRRAKKGAARVRDALNLRVAEDVRANLPSAFERASDANDQARMALQRYRQRSDSERYEVLRETAAARDNALTALFPANPSYRDSEWFNEIILSWRSLDEDVRPRLEELDLRWLPNPRYSDMRKAVQVLEKTPSISMVEHHVQELRNRRDGNPASLRLLDSGINSAREVLRALVTVSRVTVELEDIGA
ncbi:hypothetical protein ACWCY6_17495 [Streptomyces sp. 900105755]|uniref:hypothetical protein n=1 Tax=Streptomyces sp. NPDC050121 TaxID=3365601 RepID=UPI00378BC83F